MLWLRHNRSSHGTRSGFTLIEIMVVIASLAILFAIIFPLFCRARDASYRAGCASNLRQLGAAFYQYSLDWNSHWPGPGGLSGDRTYWSQSGSGGLQSYVRSRGIGSVWCCPLLTEWHGKYQPRSYSMNSYLRTPCDVEYPDCVTYPTCLSCQTGVRVCNLPVPGNTVLLFEGMPLTNGQEDKLDYLYRCANWTRVRGWTPKVACTIDSGHPWHGRFNNYLYCDGHVVCRAPGKPTKGSLSSYREMKQWYVDKARFEYNYVTYWSKYIPRD